MKKKLLFVVVILLSIISCKKDDDEISPIYGKWTVKSGGSALVYGGNLKYIIIEPDHTFYFLYEYNYGIRGCDESLCQVINGQISFYRDFYFELFNFTVAGNNLMLTNPDYEILCERNGDEPSKQEWVKTVEILQSMEAPNEDRSDLAFDGEFLWYGGRKSGLATQLYKINLATLSVVDSLEITNNSPQGLEWADGYFWTSSNGSARIYKVDPVTGSNVFTSVEMGAWIYGIGYDGELLWCGSNNERTIYPYNPNLNTFDTQYEIGCQPGGIAYAQDHLYVCANGILNKCTLYPFQSVAAYDAGKGEINGIAYDGNDFWISVSNYYETPQFKIHKVSL